MSEPGGLGELLRGAFAVGMEWVHRIEEVRAIEAGLLAADAAEAVGYAARTLTNSKVLGVPAARARYLALLTLYAYDRKDVTT